MKIEIFISVFALCISLLAGYLSWVNILKNDKRANLAITWKEEDITSAKTLIEGKERIVPLPQLRIFVNAGTIQKVYTFFTYPYDENEYPEKLVLDKYPFQKFEAAHILVHDSINSWFPKRQNKILLTFSSFNMLLPEKDATFMFGLFLGVNGTYQLIMLIYKNLSTQPTLEVLDKIDCLTYQNKNNSFYIEQFKKCEKYLLKNHIEIV